MDRNIAKPGTIWHKAKSLSARRAWIEILVLKVLSLSMIWSLSARRAWIEIIVRG